ncbi:MAG: DNA alkylation repair protein [Termitinemataceae bacterium]|nr:MAG: DNA alkylation repair protein [Termitinemataceae bacterium]
MKVKDHYNADCAKLLSQKIKTVFPDFNEKVFIKYVDKNVSDKEFFERMDVFVDAFELYLPENYENNIKIFEQILGAELEQETGMFTEGWWLWPVGRYVERHGIKNNKLSLSFIKELTKRFTGEYAIRSLLANKPKETIKTMEKWSKDGNVHVRRLASEGVRISLPWSKKIYIAIEEFEMYKKILTNLKNDKSTTPPQAAGYVVFPRNCTQVRIPLFRRRAAGYAPLRLKSKFVQKSVGNNLNDLYKEFPEKANEIIQEWKKDNPTKETLWIINHGLRSIKKNKLWDTLRS